MGLKVNVTEREAAAGDRNPLPIGNFPCAITDVRLDSPASGANVGKDMLVFSFTVQDDQDAKWQILDLNDGSFGAKGSGTQYANRVDTVNACIWEEALYTIVGILKAMGTYQDCLDSDGALDVPSDPEYYIGQRMWVRRGINKKSKEQNPENPGYWVQAQGFSPDKSAAVGSSSSASAPADASLLP
jgi:hypothetical protein